MIQFTAPGPPTGKARARSSTRGGITRHYTPDKTRSYEAVVAIFARQAMAGHPPFTVAVGCRITAYMPIPASWPKKRREAAADGRLRPTVRPDADNIAKAVLDGCNGVLWGDDAQVSELMVYRYFAADPRVHVEAWEIPSDYSG